MTDPAVRDEIAGWVAFLEAVIVDLGIYLTPSVEIWMHLGETMGTLKYYFIDHSKHTVFWLDNLDSAAVGLPESVSASHLRKHLLSVSQLLGIVLVQFAHRARLGRELLESRRAIPVSRKSGLCV